MNLSLTPQLEKFVRQCVGKGDYNNASEVVREAIRLLKRTDEENTIKLAALKNAIATGDADINQSDVTVFNSEADLDDFFATL